MERYSCRRERKTVSNPSFSSSLLDSIYRSIDQGEDEEVVAYRETMREKQQIGCSFKEKRNLCLKDEEKMDDFQRLRMIEKWMEKESEKAVGRRRSLADFVPKVKEDNPEVLFSNSSWSSSDSSSNYWFSSSEVEESVFGVSTNRPSSSSRYGMPKPKPIKTSVSTQQEKPKHEDGRGGGFEKTKSRALKIYGNLMKSKQPISPGGKLASFLNSLFTSGHAKKAKIEASSERKMIKSANASTCSSASSFSRSCLSKTASSRDGRSSNGMKRSVRFYPVSVIVDEDSKPCGHKNLYDDKKTTFVEDYKDITCSINEQVKNHIMEKNRRVEEATKDLLRNCQKRVDLQHDLRSTNHVKNQIFIDDYEEEEDDDEASCASSDLFELDNLSAIGMERYREELPVYETTYLDTNLAIAKGLIL